MLLAIYGFALLGIGLFFALLMWGFSKRFPEHFTLNVLLRGMQPESPHSKQKTAAEAIPDTEAIPDIVGDQVSRNGARNVSDVEEVQIV